MSELSSILAGIAGEYYVAAELSRHGYIASITLRNTRGLDILASSADASRQVVIQVKTNQNGERSWILQKSAEGYYADNLFYVFVSLKKLYTRPDFFIVPSEQVANQVKTSHAEWLKSPGLGGRPHHDNPMRKFIVTDETYHEKWKLLGLDSPELPDAQ